jgi:hypothetical protein
MLFALPTLRMLMDAPLGSYIDMMCFAWCMVLVALAVVLFFSALYSEHIHQAETFERYDPPQEVKVMNHPPQQQVENLMREVVSSGMSIHAAELIKLLSMKLSPASLQAAAAAAASSDHYI